MNQSVILKRSSCRLLNFLKSCSTNERRYFCFVKNNFKISRHQKCSTGPTLFRNVFTSISMARSHENTQNEPSKNVLDDKDFQSLLKDFASDFGVNNESEKILEDIKKSLDNPNVESTPETSSSDSNHSIASNKYKEFVDSDAITIRSYEDLTSGKLEELPLNMDSLDTNISTDVPKRGINGVFDLDDLVEKLHQENLADIAVISVPKEYHYADYIVLVTAQSPRHLNAVTENVVKLYKKKKRESDPFIKPEGETTNKWRALDMGNIVLHIFLQETRDFYDIESLWLLDSEYDSGGLMPNDPVFEAIQRQMDFFDTLQEPPPQNDAEN